MQQRRKGGCMFAQNNISAPVPLQWGVAAHKRSADWEIASEGNLFRLRANAPSSFSNNGWEKMLCCFDGENMGQNTGENIFVTKWGAFYGHLGFYFCRTSSGRNTLSIQCDGIVVKVRLRRDHLLFFSPQIWRGKGFLWQLEEKGDWLLIAVILLADTYVRLSHLWSLSISSFSQ